MNPAADLNTNFLAGGHVNNPLDQMIRSAGHKDLI